LHKLWLAPFRPSTPASHNALVELLDPDVLRLTVRLDGVGKTWRGGQHAYVSIPSVGRFEAHPFSFASVPGTADGVNDAVFIVRVHDGEFWVAQTTIGVDADPQGLLAGCEIGSSRRR
jgi:hypothetical protein